MKTTPLQRLLAKVQKHAATGCWNWTGALFTKGYGKFTMNGKQVQAHRVSYELHAGKTIPKELFACHTCDNKRCVNPEHIFLGTQRDNIQDALQKGIMKAGTRSTNAKLDEVKIADIIQRRIRGEFIHVLAREYDVSSRAIISLCKGECYKAERAKALAQIGTNEAKPLIKKFVSSPKLKVDQTVIDAIWNERPERGKAKRIAHESGVSTFTVYRIWRGEKHISDSAKQ